MQLKLNKGSQTAFTLVEVCVSLIIIVMVFSATIVAYIHSSQRMMWSGYYLAAQAQAVQMIERVKAAQWDSQATPVIDNTTNLPAVTATILQLPISGTNVVWVTNYLTVTSLTNSTSPMVIIKMITVQAVWPWLEAYSSNTVYYTNTLVSYRGPTQ